ncbi:alpha/beta hydrolase family protein [uncultured Sphaerochaeta sp.]|uniref:dienelactone hydrolase family protein n=1 Tax=uncultured Sphaerochaeta sp. TaxID=886478 RepID=UPI002A0A2703|nr:alpha/beta hydrolase family protein [uncultured Sphaerochaeta sp.]
MFYGSLKSFESKFDALARKEAFQGKTAKELLAWQKSAQTKLCSLLGLELMERISPIPVVLDHTRLENGITREKVLIRTEDEVFMPFYILIPDSAGPDTRIFICPAGHQGAGKESVAGNGEQPLVKQMISFYNYDYALKLAKAGFVAVAPDPRGFSERRDEAKQAEEDILSSTCFHLAHMAEPLGYTVPGLLVWDLMRLVDYLVERGNWSVEDIAVLGFSGGGMQSLYLAALEPRIQMAFISGYFYGFKDSLLVLNGNCSCNYVPSLWRSFDMGDIASLFAPRPLVIQSCSEDHLNGSRGMKNVQEQYAIVQKNYELLGASKKLYHDIVSGEHHFSDTHMLLALETVLGEVHA